MPPVSILNFQAGQTIANAAIVPLGPGEQINVNVSHSTHVLMDVNGYFSDTLNNGQNFLSLTNNSTSFTALFTNNNGGCSSQCGVVADVANGWAVFGNSHGAGSGGVNIGVRGDSDNDNGVWANAVYGWAAGQEPSQQRVFVVDRRRRREGGDGLRQDR